MSHTLDSFKAQIAALQSKIDLYQTQFNLEVYKEAARNALRVGEALSVSPDAEDDDGIDILLTTEFYARRIELLQIVAAMAQAQANASVMLDNKSATVFEIVQREYPKMAKLVGLHLPEVEA